MKRRYYKIHAVDHARPMKRVKHHHIIWSHVLLAALALVLVVVGVLAIIKWVGMGASKKKKSSSAQPAVIPVMTVAPETTASPEQLPTAEPSASAAPRAVSEVSPVADALPEAFGFNYKIMYNGEEQASHSAGVSFGRPETYASAAGILAFAGDNWRTGFSYGAPDISEMTMQTVWQAPVGFLDMSDVHGSGTGWTGQPLIVQWSDEVRPVLGVYDEFKAMQGFTEVICPAMDGKIYFMELYSGRQSRAPLDVGVIMSGAAALDPAGRPLLYAGQSVTSTDGNFTGAWVRVIDLIKNEVVYKFGGKDPFSPRVYQAYDSSPLVSAEADTLIMPGENGVIYFVHLNSRFDAASGSVSVSPDPLLKFKYSVAEGYSSTDAEGLRQYGFESSCACFGHYLFIADNGGRVQCIDMNTLQLKYVLDVTSDTDASIVLEQDVTDGNVYLYTANRAAGEGGKGCHRKFNAMTGELVWQNEYNAGQNGTIATPHVGRGRIGDLVIYSAASAEITYTGSDGSEQSGYGGLIVAYDKRTGEEVWRYTQKNGYWASPAVVYASDGAAYIVQADIGGTLSLHTASDGKLAARLDLGSKIESTPAIFNGYIVVGTRGVGGSGSAAAIFCIKLG